MANTTTAVLNALRYTYGSDRVLYLFNTESVLFNILGKVKRAVGGRGQFILPIMKQNPGAFTGISEGGSLPSGLDAKTTEALFSLQEYVAVYTLSWKLIQDSARDKFAFQQAVQMLDDGLKNRVMRNLNADLLDDGRGRLGIQTGASSSNVSTVDSLPLVEVGMVVDLMDTDNGTKNGDSLSVTGVDPIARTITTTGTISGDAAGDYFVIQDTTDDPTYLHSYGLLGVIDDADPAKGSYGGIARATAGNEFWKSPVLDNGGTNRVLTEDLLLQAMDQAREKGGVVLDAWISNLPLTRRYHDILRADTFVALSQPGALGGGIGRKGAGEGKADGRTPYEFSGIPWHVDPYFHANTMVGIDSSHFYLGVGDNDVPRPISEIFDNVPFFKQTSSATFDVNWYYQMQLLSNNTAAGVKLEDIAEA